MCSTDCVCQFVEVAWGEHEYPSAESPWFHCRSEGSRILPEAEGSASGTVDWPGSIQLPYRIVFSLESGLQLLQLNGFLGSLLQGSYYPNKWLWVQTKMKHDPKPIRFRFEFSGSYHG